MTDPGAGGRGIESGREHPSQRGVAPDESELESFGYRPELRRAIGGLAMFASTFALLSVLVGFTALYGLSYTFAGPGLVWTVPVVFLGMLPVALLFAELAGSFPLAGSIYQWSERLGGRRWGSMTGFIYIGAWLILFPAVATGLQTTLTAISPTFELIGHGVPGIFDKAFAENAIILGGILFAFTTVINYLSIRLVAILGYIGLASELLGVAAILVLTLAHISRGPAVDVHSLGLGKGHAWGYLGALLVAGYLPFLNFFGFDQAAQLSEESADPRRHAPRSIVRALALSALLTFLLCLFIPMAVGKVDDPNIGTGGIGYIIVSLSSDAVGKAVLAMVAIALICAGVAGQTITSRMLFSVARDGQLLGSRMLGHVDRRTRTPSGAIAFSFLFALVLLAINIGNPKVFEAIIGIGTVLVYVGYLGVVIPAIRARVTNRWEPDRAHFNLGRWGPAVAIAGGVWLVIGVVNFGWPRREYYGTAWYQQYSAIIVVGAVLILGVIHQLLVRRSDESEAIAEHRPSAVPSADPVALAAGARAASPGNAHVE